MTESIRPVHAELSASTSDRWWHCPGSINAVRTLPALPAPSFYAMEGTAMHLAASTWLITNIEPDWAITKFCGMLLNEDHADAVREYVTTIWADRETYGGELLIEKRCDLSSLRHGMFGTCDAILLNCKDHILRVYDFKGGSGVVVEVERNSQAMYYGYAAVLTLKAGPIKALELIIVQPRAPHKAGPIRRWRIEILDAFDWSQDLLDAAARTDDPKAELHAGPWCRFCPAAGVCKELERYSMQQALEDFRDNDADPLALPVVPPKPTSGSGGAAAPLPDPRLMTNDDLGRLLPKLDILEAWITLARHHALGEAEAGRPILGHKLVPRRGRRKWVDEDRDVIASLHQLGLSNAQIFDTSLKSPPQIEKIMPKAQRALLAALVHKVSSGNVLAPDDDDRPDVSRTIADDFEPVETDDPFAIGKK